MPYAGVKTSHTMLAAFNYYEGTPHGPTLSAYIKETYDINLGVRQCQRLFHELGYSKIRPQVFPSKGYEDTEARNEFKKT